MSPSRSHGLKTEEFGRASLSSCSRPCKYSRLTTTRFYGSRNDRSSNRKFAFTVRVAPSVSRIQKPRTKEFFRPKSSSMRERCLFFDSLLVITLCYRSRRFETIAHRTVDSSRLSMLTPLPLEFESSGTEKLFPPTPRDRQDARSRVRGHDIRACPRRWYEERAPVRGWYAVSGRRRRNGGETEEKDG